MSGQKPTIYFYYGEDAHSKKLTDYIAANIKTIKPHFLIKQQKIAEKSQLDKLMAVLVQGGICPPNKYCQIPFAIIRGVIYDISQFAIQLKNLTTIKKAGIQPDSVSVEDWNSAILATGDEEPDTIDSSSIAKRMEKFNKSRANRTTDQPVAKRPTKSYSNDEDFQSASGLDNVSSPTYDFNSGDNILEQLRLDEAIGAGKVGANKPIRRG